MSYPTITVRRINGRVSQVLLAYPERPEQSISIPVTHTTYSESAGDRGQLCLMVDSSHVRFEEVTSA